METLGLERSFDLGGRRTADGQLWNAVQPLMVGPYWSAAAVYVDAGGETDKSTIWLSPKAVELMKPLPVFVDWDGPRPDEVEQFLGAGDDFDPITVELPDDLPSQVLPAVIERWIGHEIGEMNTRLLFVTIGLWPCRWFRPLSIEFPDKPFIQVGDARIRFVAIT